DAAIRDGDPNVVVLPLSPAAAAVPMFADVAPADPDADAPGGEVPDGLSDGFPADGFPDDGDLAEWVHRRVIAAVAGELGLDRKSGVEGTGTKRGCREGRATT